MGIKRSILFTCVMFLGSVQCCYITNFIDMNVMERFIQSDYVVYGQTVEHDVRELTFKSQRATITDAVFDVYCILKGDSDMAERITISGIAPRYGCSGTPIGDIMAVNVTAIVALKNNSASTYTLDEVMPNLSAAVIPYKLYFSSLGNLCGMQNWRAPIGANINRCPVCGTSNYSTDVQLHPDLTSLLTCVYINHTITDMTKCELYLTDSFVNVEAQTCIPADYSQTCVTLEYRNASVSNCDCNRNADGSIFTGGCDQNVLSVALMCALVLFWIIYKY